MKLIRTGANQYRIEGFDRDTLKDMAKALQLCVTEAHKKGRGGYTFEPVIELIATKSLERMRIRRDYLATQG